MKCRICSSEATNKFLSLGHQPPSDAFLSEEQVAEREVYYPLDLYFCDNCKLIQLGYTVDPSELFNEDYAYNTATSKELKDNFLHLTEQLSKCFNLTTEDLAIDIGSNDGTLLEGYLRYGIKILGIEPSGTANLAIAKNIPTIKAFFNKKTANMVMNVWGKAKVITATNVFAHVDDLAGFMEGLNLLLADNGFFVCESHHLLSLIEKVQFDSIYHEHLRYYSLKPLMYLFNLYDMDVFNAELIPTHGGSIRVYACRRGVYPIDFLAIREIIDKEEKAGLYLRETFFSYSKNIIGCRVELQNLLRKIKMSGEKIVGLGAPAKGNTLLNYCHIGLDILDYLAETSSSLKIGKYSPGMHIKVVDEAQLFVDQPGYALLLSWNLKDIIVPKLRSKGYKGKIIVPVPSPYIIE